MKKICLLLACAVCSSPGCRLQTDGQHDLKYSDKTAVRRAKALASLILAVNPSVAFNPSGARSPECIPTLESSPVQLRSLSAIMRETRGRRAAGKQKSKKQGSSPAGGGFGKAVKAKFPYSGKLRPGKQTPTRHVPEEIPRPDYAEDGIPKDVDLNRFELNSRIRENSDDDIKGMRAAGLVARKVLDAAGRAVAVGVTTDEIDRIVHEETISHGAYPSPLNYRGFPKSCCTSVNEVICHGIPDSRELKDGDIVNIDVTCFYGGYHGDCSETFCVGNVDEKGKQLVKVTYDAWQAAIEYCKPDKPFNGIGSLIEDYIKQYGYSSNPEFAGHGVCKRFHQNPTILHIKNSQTGIMKVGHTFTIEPMICEGKAKSMLWEDDWTATTIDGKRSAQFEHTLLVTPDGVEALTARLPDSNKFWWEEVDEEMETE